MKWLNKVLISAAIGTLILSVIIRWAEPIPDALSDWWNKSEVAVERTPSTPLPQFNLVEQIQSWLGIIPVQIWVFILIVLILALWFSTGRVRRVAGMVFGVIFATLIAFGFAEFWESTATETDRLVNHGDLSDPADYIKTVKNGTVTIPKGGFDRFLAIGAIKIRNTSEKQCMRPRPSTEHTYRRIGDKYIVTELDGTPIYTMSWSGDGWTYIIEMALERTEVITVTTVPLGQIGCRPVSL